MASNLGGNYALGLTNPPTPLEDNLLPDPYPSTLQPFTQALDTAMGKRYVGRPIATWKWGMLTQAEYTRLVEMVSAGSQPVFIRTRVHSGVKPTYTDFAAIMHFPKAGTFQAGGLWKDVEIEFTNLVNADSSWRLDLSAQTHPAGLVHADLRSYIAAFAGSLGFSTARAWMQTFAGWVVSDLNRYNVFYSRSSLIFLPTIGVWFGIDADGEQIGKKITLDGQASTFIWTGIAEPDVVSKNTESITYADGYVYAGWALRLDGSWLAPWVIEKRDAQGGLIWTSDWVYSNVSPDWTLPYAICVVGSSVLMCGMTGSTYRSILKVSTADGSGGWLVEESTDFLSTFSSISNDSADDTVFYVGCGTVQAVASKVQKRNVSDGSVIWTREFAYAGDGYIYTVCDYADSLFVMLLARTGQQHILTRINKSDGLDYPGWTNFSTGWYGDNRDLTRPWIDATGIYLCNKLDTLYVLGFDGSVLEQITQTSPRPIQFFHHAGTRYLYSDAGVDQWQLMELP